MNGIFKKGIEDKRKKRYITPTRVLWKNDLVIGEEILLKEREIQVPQNNANVCKLKKTVQFF